MSSRARLLIAGAVLLVFAQTLGAGFVWDDLVLIDSNARLRGPDAWANALRDDFWETSVSSGAVREYWRPIPKLAHVLCVALGGGGPFPFHLLNVLLHLGSSLLVFEWLKRRLGNDGVEERPAVQGAAAGSLVFALHPSRFEAVGWAASSTELFFVIFFLVGFVSLEARGKWRLPLGLTSFALAMACKETGLIIPMVLLADSTLRGRLRERASFVAGSVLAILAPLVVRAWLGHALPNVGDEASLLERCARTLGTVAGYHLRTVLPLEVTVFPVDVPMVRPSIYAVPVVLWVAGLLLVLGWIGFAVATLYRPNVRTAFADALLWLFFLAPVMQWKSLPTPVLVSERFLYGALLGACALLARGVAASALRETLAQRLRLVVSGVCLIWAVMLSLAWPAFDDNVALFTRELTLHPDSEYVLEAYARLLVAPHQKTARKLALERLLEKQLNPAKRAIGLALLAQVSEARLTDADVEELRHIRAYFDGLRAGRPPAVLTLGGRSWAVPSDTAVNKALVETQERVFIEAATFHLHVRLGGSAEAIRWAERNRTQSPSPYATEVLARFLSLHERFDEARQVLREDDARFPGLTQGPLAVLIEQGAQLQTSPLDPLELALRRASLFSRLGSPLRARLALAPFAEEARRDRRVLDARVQIEVEERRFDAAEALLEAARGQVPGVEADLVELREAKAAWVLLIQRQLENLPEPIRGTPN